MEVRVLMENTAISPEYREEHGLSLYIEYRGRRILFDTGASAQFLENAERMDVDIAKVEYCVLSHGHYDHGGGLEAFLEANKTARLYLSPRAKGSFWGREDRYLGLDLSVLERHVDRLVWVEADMPLFPGAGLVTKIEHCGAEIPDQKLYERIDGRQENDRFEHELVMTLELPEGLALFTGCGHSGIYNMLQTVERRSGKKVEAVFGGLHWMHCDEVSILALAQELLSLTPRRIYTGHCTGEKGLAILQARLLETRRLQSGARFSLEGQAGPEKAEKTRETPAFFQIDA